MYIEDTIAAIATAPGEGGIGIVRISGEMAESILRSIFVPVNQEKAWENRSMTYGYIVDSQSGTDDEPAGKKIDEVMAVLMKAPHTYTREDVVEINCHGSMVALRKTLSLVLRHGARLAEPGEFTKRAFLNGRIDLSQAEAVIDLIQAKTDQGYGLALDQLAGGLSDKVRELREALVEVLVTVAVNIDYPDEDIEEISYQSLQTELKKIENDLQRLLKTIGTGKILREGLNTVIVGKPNVGKSSLMNRLLGENRSIVTDIPGTTRDTIEELLNLEGIFLKITDTAGIRETKDKVEEIGVEKSRKTYQKADLILFLLDGSAPLSLEDMEIIEEIQEKRAIVLINKIDCGQRMKKEEIQKLLPGKVVIETSMTDGRGILDIQENIAQMVFDGAVKSADGITITNVRHGELIQRAHQSIQEARIATEIKQALEIVEIDIKRSWELLGEIIGETVQEDLISEIFARFCLGK